jgi:hypothetical protein
MITRELVRGLRGLGIGKFAIPISFFIRKETGLIRARSFTTTGDTGLGSYSYPDTAATTTVIGFEQNAFGNVFESQNMLFAGHDQYASGSSQEVDIDPMMLDQNSFLRAPSDSAALSATSYSSTPIDFVDDQYTSGDVSMWDGEVGDAGRGQEGGELLCYGMVSQPLPPFASSIPTTTILTYSPAPPRACPPRRPRNRAA